MFFSILVPVYNVEKYLKECLDSILNQTEQDFEIILVNDGSLDSSGEICESYQKKYPNKIKVFHQQNRGLFLTRCVGMEKAKGIYFVFVDSDDYLRSDALKVIKRTIEQYHVDLVLFNYYRAIDGTVKKQPPIFSDQTIFKDEELKKLYQAFFNGKLNNVWTKVIHHSLVDKSDDYLKVPRYVEQGEDILHSFSMIANSRCAIYLDESLYYYRLNQKSITSQFNKDSYQSLKYIWNQAERFQFQLDELAKEKMIASGKLNTVCYEIGSITSKKCPWNCKEKIMYLKKIANDSFFIMAYDKGGSKNKKIATKFILYLLRKKYIVSIYFLVSIAKKNNFYKQK